MRVLWEKVKPATAEGGWKAGAAGTSAPWPPALGNSAVTWARRRGNTVLNVSCEVLA